MHNLKEKHVKCSIPNHLFHAKRYFASILIHPTIVKSRLGRISHSGCQPFICGQSQLLVSFHSETYLQSLFTF